MPRVIAIGNQKGGVGKTSVALNLAACLALAGRSVLALDLDPQGNLAQGLEVESPPQPAIKTETPLARALLGGHFLLDTGGPTAIPGLAVVPSLGLALEAIEGRLAGLLDGLGKLSHALAPLAQNFVVIDCRPSLGALTRAALLAADLIITPVTADRYSLEGLSHLLAAAKGQARRSACRVLVNKFNPRLSVSDWLDSELMRAGLAIMRTRIRQNEAINVAAVMQVPVAVHAPRSHGAADFRALAAEVEALWQD